MIVLFGRRAAGLIFRGGEHQGAKIGARKVGRAFVVIKLLEPAHFVKALRTALGLQYLSHTKILRYLPAFVVPQPMKNIKNNFDDIGHENTPVDSNKNTMLKFRVQLSSCRRSRHRSQSLR